MTIFVCFYSQGILLFQLGRHSSQTPAAEAQCQQDPHRRLGERSVFPHNYLFGEYISMQMCTITFFAERQQWSQPCTCKYLSTESLTDCWSANIFFR